MISTCGATMALSSQSMFAAVYGVLSELRTTHTIFLYLTAANHGWRATM
jgi:hypothetical protein